MLRSLSISLFFLFVSFFVRGNNLNLGSTVKILNVTSSEITLQVNVRWENSWRDSYNNDAAWIFFKYRTAGSDWAHLNPGDSITANNGFRVLPGRSDGLNVGFFLYRDRVGSGVSETECLIKWHYPSWIKADMFTSNQVFIMAQGIEMVYIPFGGYSLGDGISDNSFCGEDGNTPFNITGPDVLDFQSIGGDFISLSDIYSNGYKGYYVMKYELSQEQYVAFINSLTRDQQVSLLGNRVATLQKGDYLFGSSSAASRRNGIIVSQAASSIKPAVFDNNLNGDDNYGDETDGQTLACNYLSVRDLLGYASWSGLRPMTELEYEKSCGRLLPQGNISAVYAWGSSAFSPMSALTSETEGRREESPASGNVNANGAFGFAPGDGPVRCGAFAAIASSRETAGAGFSGIMEMSGNVGELCVNTQPGITNRFDGSVHGNGAFNPDLWSGKLSASFFGVRGGGFSSIPDRLRICDRDEMSGRFSSSDLRDSTVGFRVVRMLNPDELHLEAGEVGISSVTVCSGVPFTIRNVKDATVAEISGVIFSYEWYKDGVLIPDARGASLSYSSGIYNPRTADAVYRFTRKAVCALGEVETDVVAITVPGKLELKLPVGISEASLLCGTGTSVVASRLRTGNFIWKNPSSGDIDQTTAGVATDTYVPSHKAFGYLPGLRKLRCISEMNGCRDSIDISVRVEPSCSVALSAEVISLKSLTDASNVTATLCGAGHISWFYKDGGGIETLIGSASEVSNAVYTPQYSDFANGLGERTVVCRTTTGSETGCKDEKSFIVQVSAELSAGAIAGPAITCGGTSVSITNRTLPGVVGMSGLSFTYQWFKDGSTTPIVGETGADLLNYPLPANGTANTVRHSFTRKAICTAPTMTSALTAAVNIDVPGTLSVSPVSLTLASGVASNKATASRSLSGTFNWYYKNSGTETLISDPVSGTSSDYIPAHGHFANTVGEKTVICRSAIVTPEGTCSDVKELTVNVSLSIDAGTISGPATACPGTSISLTSTKEAIVKGSDAVPVYEWYLGSQKLTGTAAYLNPTTPANTTMSAVTYTYTRKAIYTGATTVATSWNVSVYGKPSASIAVPMPVLTGSNLVPLGVTVNWNGPNGSAEWTLNGITLRAPYTVTAANHRQNLAYTLTNGCMQSAVSNSVAIDVLSYTTVGDLVWTLTDVYDYNFTDAQKMCANLGAGWRVPTMEEWRTLPSNNNVIGLLVYPYSGTDLQGIWNTSSRDDYRKYHYWTTQICGSHPLSNNLNLIWWQMSPNVGAVCSPFARLITVRCCRNK